MTDRERIAARIRGLLAKTVENGCTEAEALAAAQMAADMLAKYNLTVDEVELRASPFARHTEQHEDPVGDRLWKPASAIAELTGATYWVSPRGTHPVQINFFGFKHEVDVARYLLEICARAMRQEYRRQNQAFALLVPAARRRKTLPFLDGMADRLHQRIKAMVPPMPTGTGLIVLRGALIKAAMDLEKITLKDQRARGSRDYESSYVDGMAAADRVALRPGMAGADSRRMLR